MTHEQFTRQYLPLCGKMYALAYNLLRDRNEARDCVQDVYAELWAPFVIVNVIVNEEHHYHEGSIHMDIRDSFITE